MHDRTGAGGRQGHVSVKKMFSRPYRPHGNRVGNVYPIGRLPGRNRRSG